LAALLGALLLTGGALAASSAGGSKNQPDCSGAVAELTVKRFLAALSRGDISALSKVFASKPNFGWYSTTAPGERRTRVAEDRSSLPRYFRKRVAQHEQMRITKRHGGEDAPHNTAHLNGLLVRRARDLAPTLFNFKTSVLCSSPPQIIVWSMARDS
jgi:hypothetical protein